MNALRFIGLAALLGCETQSVMILPGDTGVFAPKDSGVPPSDAGFSDSGTVPDSGATPDTGIPPSLHCPASIAEPVVSEYFGLNLAYPPRLAGRADYFAAIYAKQTQAGVRLGSILSRRDGSVLTSGFSFNYDDPMTPPHIVPLDEDSFLVAAQLPGPVFSNHVLSASEPTMSASRFAWPEGWSVTDVDSLNGAVVVASTSSTGATRLESVSYMGRPVGFGRVERSNAFGIAEEVTYALGPEGQPLASRGHWLLSIVDSELNFPPGRELMVTALRSNGSPAEISFSFACGQIVDYDPIALSDEKLMFVKDCVFNSQLEIISRIPAEPGKIIGMGDTRTPSRIATDGRTVGLVRWPTGADAPTIRFYDLDGEPLGEPLVLDVFTATGTPDAIDVAASPGVDGAASRWAVSVGWKQDQQTADGAGAVITFDGCVLK